MAEMKNLKFAKMNEKAASQIARWRYKAPYDVYNANPDQIEETVRWYLESKNKYYAVWTGTDELIGFRCFGVDAQVPGGDYSTPALDMGGGLKPTLTGQGLGAAFMLAAMDFAIQNYHPLVFRATVAAFNQRALRVCEKVGYQKMNSFESMHSGKPFVILIKERNDIG